MIKTDLDEDMPEGPEVHALRDWFELNTKDMILRFPTIRAGRYSRKTLEGWDLIEGHELMVEKVGCKGKFLWVEFMCSTGNKVYLEHTLGLSGAWNLILFREGDKNWLLPPQTRITFLVTPSAQSKFLDELHDSLAEPGKQVLLVYSDQRNFGTLSFSSTSDSIREKLDKLAPDLLTETFSHRDSSYLEELIKRWIAEKPRYRLKKNIVQVLMGQLKTDSFGSGIGNYLAAEILYRAKISPFRELGTLTLDEVANLAKSIHYNFAYFSGFEYYPENYREAKDQKFCVYGKKTDPQGRRVETCSVVTGRTMWWVPGVQL